MSRPTSLYLDGFRFVAALFVFLYHAGFHSGFRIMLVGNFGQEGVIIFFVLSGLVISYSAERKHSDVVDYGIARLARLWSVVLPALVLTFIVDIIGQSIDLGAYGNLHPLAAWKWPIVLIANATFLSEFWNLDIWPGTNGAFWSLPFEFWYYVMFGVAYYFTGYRRLLLVFMAGCVAGSKILIAFPVWLIGVTTYHAMKRWHGAPAQGWVLWIGSFGILIAWGWFGATAYLHSLFSGWPQAFDREVVFWPKSYSIGLLLALNFYGFSVIGHSFEPLLSRGARWIRIAADSSFSLYLFHYPLILFFKAIATWIISAGMGDATWLIPTFVYLGPLCVVFPLVRYWEAAKVAIALALNRSVGRALPA